MAHSTMPILTVSHKIKQIRLIVEFRPIIIVSETAKSGRIHSKKAASESDKKVTAMLLISLILLETKEMH